ncbi:MAG: TlpA family protein disulfide reductase [Planctomycetota bacterium]|jgi:thiol-disulfide isomerase/thioredoxin
MKYFKIASLIIICAIFVSAFAAGAHHLGILGQTAPAWEGVRWHNLPEDKKTLDISDYKGKILYLYCFQSWCPGCHRHGFPTLTALIKKYEGKDDVAFVTIQTAFEGFGSNNYKTAAATAKRYRLDIPVGHSGSAGERSKIMQSYRTGGTPWTIIIDKSGNVRYNDFHISVDKAAELIERLREEQHIGA